MFWPVIHTKMSLFAQNVPFRNTVKDITNAGYMVLVTEGWENEDSRGQKIFSLHLKMKMPVPWESCMAIFFSCLCACFLFLFSGLSCKYCSSRSIWHTSTKWKGNWGKSVYKSGASSGQRLSWLLYHEATRSPRGYPSDFLVGWASRLFKSRPYFRLKQVIFHTRFQTWPQKPIPIFRPVF